VPTFPPEVFDVVIRASHSEVLDGAAASHGVRGVEGLAVLACVARQDPRRVTSAELARLLGRWSAEAIEAQLRLLRRGGAVAPVGLGGAIAWRLTKHGGQCLDAFFGDPRVQDWMRRNASAALVRRSILAAREPGKALRGWRRALGRSQAELARKAGVSRNTVTRTENGNTNPRQNGLAALAKALTDTD
jgi:DNA-binding XRE family transcriptional regulator